MSDEKKPTPPSSGGGSTAPSNPVQPCPKCNCCVTSAVIENVIFVGSAGMTSPNTGRKFYNGHIFDFHIKMTFTGGSPTVDCSMEWWEKVNIPAIAGHKPNVWTDMYAFYSESPTLAPWTKRTNPCPSGGSTTVVIRDPPSLGNAPGRTLTRTLEFKLVAKSGSGCPCAITSATARATQVLVMVNGVLDTAASSFTIGASSQTP